MFAYTILFLIAFSAIIVGTTILVLSFRHWYQQKKTKANSQLE